MRDLVYISFSYADDTFRNELREILVQDVRLQKLVWDDKLLPEGENFWDIINKHVARARIMVMLVSPTYFNRRCSAWKCEIPQALEAHEKGELIIMWIPIRLVRPADTPFPNI